VDIDPTMTQTDFEIWTIGHSTRSIDEFLEALKFFSIQTLADVRSFPGSRRYPQFNQDRLQGALAEAEIDYVHMPELGGRRRARADSQNLAWRNESFRGYADYMETEDFGSGIAQLLEIAQTSRSAIMCAEALWWRCHRSLISDYLKAKGIRVTHIISNRKSEPHRFTSAAQLVNGHLSYRGLLNTVE